MSRNRLLILGAIVALFIAAGGFFALRGGGGGQAVTIDLRVTGASMQPDSPSARLNDTVTLTITADRDEEIHLHGYDLAFDCQAGRPASRTFKADKTGAFDVEIESTSQHLGTFTVSP